MSLKSPETGTLSAPFAASNTPPQDGSITPEQVAEATRRRTEEVQAQIQAGELNNMDGLQAFFMVIMQLFQSLGEGNVLSALNSSFGSDISSTLGTAFGVDNASGLIRGAASRPPAMGNIDVGERQDTVNAHIHNAAAIAGISPELLQGVWGIETHFGTHSTLVSASGCSGDFQFTQTTFNEMIQEHGNDIARHVSDPDIANALRSGNWRIETEWGSDLRFHPEVATYAAAFYLDEVADIVGVDAHNPENFGTIFAGYNIGPGNAARLHDSLFDRANAGAIIGDPASWNPAFFAGGVSGREVLERYGAHVAARTEDYQRFFGDEPQQQRLIADASSQSQNSEQPQQDLQQPALGGPTANV